MFNTCAEAQNWIEAGQSKHGKRAFTSRPEYAEAYAEMTALFHAEKSKLQKSQIARTQRALAQLRSTFLHTV